VATLREQITSDVSTVFLNEEDFAESCTYISKVAGPRTVVCEVEETSELIVEASGRFQVTTMRVFCSRHTTTGIDNPQIGDAFKRENTPAEQVFTYVGIAPEVDEAAWTLIFERRAPYSRGGGR
jgi:hypothetical protein